MSAPDTTQENEGRGSQDDALLLECLELMEKAGPSEVDKLLSACPDQALMIRQKLDLLQEFGLLDLEDTRNAKDLPDSIGGFDILSKLGSGGMGVVYLAEQRRLGRRVALKLIRPEVLHFGKAKARFEREVKAASRLQHAGICPVYEVGEIEGMPYMAMPYIEGAVLSSLISKARDRREQGSGATQILEVTPDEANPDGSPSFGARLDRLLLFFEEAALAAHAAHEAGLVHRDLKPANFMVNTEGHPVLLDFGLAIDEQDTNPGLTRSGDRLGTPAYMSPEIIEGKPVDRRADVYSLGVSLYEALTLECPYQASTLDSLYRQILRTDAKDPRKLEPRLPKDLVTVVATAMEKEPGQRYTTALELAEDLRRVREKHPILAHPPGALQKAARWAQRNPLPTALLTLLLVSLMAVTWFLGQSRTELRRANSLALVGASIEALQADPVRAILLAHEAHEQRPSLETRSQLSKALALNHERKVLRKHQGMTFYAAFSPDGKFLVSHGDRAEMHLWTDEGDWIAQLEGGIRKIMAVDFSRDGSSLVAGSYGPLVKVWDMQGKEQASLSLMSEGQDPKGRHGTVNLGYFADGRIWVATQDGQVLVFGKDHSVPQRFHPLPKQEAVAEASSSNHPAPQDPRIADAVLSLDERSLFISYFTGKLLRMDLESGETLHETSIPGLPAWVRTRLRRSPGANRILAWTIQYGDQAWLLDGDLVDRVGLIGHSSYIQDACFSPEGDQILTCSWDMTGRIWNLEGKELQRLRGHDCFLYYGAFLQDGRIVTSGEDMTLRIWSADGLTLNVLRGHSSSVDMVAIHPAGQRLASVGKDSSVRLWNIAIPNLPVLTGHDLGAIVVWALMDQDRIFTTSLGGTLSYWNRAGKLEKKVKAMKTLLTQIDMTPDGSEILVSGQGAESLLILDAEGKIKDVLPLPAQPSAIVFMDEGNKILLSSPGRDPAPSPLFLWTKEDGRWPRQAKPLLNLDKEFGRAWSMNASPSGKRIVLGGTLGKTRIYRLEGEKLVQELEVDHEGQLALRVTFTWDESRILTAHADRVGRVWDARTGALLLELEGHESEVSSIESSPDGQWILTTSYDGTARLWNAKDGSPWLILSSNDGIAFHGCFSHDSRKVMIANSNGTVRTWWVNEEDLLEEVAQSVTRDFSETERKKYAELLR